MQELISILPLMIQQSLKKQKLERVEESSSLTTDASHVSDYNQMRTTLFVINYALALDVISRLHAGKEKQTAIDLACGPGHFSISLANYLNFQRVFGLDLSDEMLETARANSKNSSLSEQVQFIKQDIRYLNRFEDQSVDLACFNHAAHHLHDLKDVRQVLTEMDRVTQKDGTVVLVDVARFKTTELTDKYVKTFGADYLRQGLKSLYLDFESSMFAAWSVDELAQARPEVSQRSWFQLVPFGVPMLQMIIGLPSDQVPRLQATASSVQIEQLMVPKEFKIIWKLARWSLLSGRLTRL